MIKIDPILQDVVDELQMAANAFPNMRSPHEGWAIIREELDELWDLVRKKPDQRVQGELYTEAKQVAAMALRFMRDVAAKP